MLIIVQIDKDFATFGKILALSDNNERTINMQALGVGGIPRDESLEDEMFTSIQQ